MKNLITLIAMLFIGMSQVKAQSMSLDSIRPLKVGDNVPDILMGEVSNYLKKEMRISDFRGKLLILDFWSTSCAPCIAAFPSMEKLQKQFEGKIQIVLTNAFESNEKIEKKMKRNVSSLSSLPVVVQAEKLRSLFPLKGVPHHVWIDKDGIVRLIGSSMNTHPKKISQLLNGEKIDFISNFSSATELDTNRPFSMQTNLPQKNISSYSSYLTDYNNIFYSGGRVSKNILDTSTNTIRNTFVNIDVIKLYSQIMIDNETWTTKIVGPDRSSQYRDAIILKVKDSLNYSSDYYKNLTDEMHKKSRYCYEQVYGANLSESEQKGAMLRDLNNAFGKLYGTKGEIIKRVIPCYYVVRLDDEQVYLNSMNKLQGISLKSNVKTELLLTVSNFFHANEQENPFVFDIADYHTAPSSMEFKQWKKGDKFKDLVAALNVYGFDLIKGEKEVEMMLISEI